MDHTRMDLDGESIFCPEEEESDRIQWTEELRQEKRGGWAKLLAHMKQREAHYPKHVYRHFVIEDPRSSYRHGTLPIMFESDYHIDWPQEFFTSPEEQGWSIHRLARVLRRHVRKNENPYHSAFVSSSGNIYWSVYRTGQRSKNVSSTQVACMAVFDMQEILNGEQTVLWYLPNLMEYLDPQRRFFSDDDRRWAQNNEEYITWAFLPMDALVYWSTWEELTSPDIGFLQERRYYWYTLALFETHTSPTSITAREYIGKIVKFAKQCGGGTDDNDRIFELAVAAFESSSRSHWSWAYTIVPHLDSPTARCLLERSLGLKPGVPTEEHPQAVELDLSKLSLDD